MTKEELANLPEDSREIKSLVDNFVSTHYDSQTKVIWYKYLVEYEEFEVEIENIWSNGTHDKDTITIPIDELIKDK